MGLQGVLPVEPRIDDGVGADFAALGLVDVRQIMDSCRRRDAPVIDDLPAPPFMQTVPPSYLEGTCTSTKRASKAIARRELRETRRVAPPTARERRARVLW